MALLAENGAAGVAAPPAVRKSLSRWMPQAMWLMGLAVLWIGGNACDPPAPAVAPVASSTSATPTASSQASMQPLIKPEHYPLLDALVSWVATGSEEDLVVLRRWLLDYPGKPLPEPALVERIAMARTAWPADYAPRVVGLEVLLWPIRNDLATSASVASEPASSGPAQLPGDAQAAPLLVMALERYGERGTASADDVPWFCQQSERWVQLRLFNGGGQPGQRGFRDAVGRIWVGIEGSVASQRLTLLRVQR